jgi:hypothetical protein
MHEGQAKAGINLFGKKLDLNYKVLHGSTLLMSVIVSCFPNEWKEKAAMTLIEKGV